MYDDNDDDDYMATEVQTNFVHTRGCKTKHNKVVGLWDINTGKI